VEHRAFQNKNGQAGYSGRRNSDMVSMRMTRPILKLTKPRVPEVKTFGLGEDHVGGAGEACRWKKNAVVNGGVSRPLLLRLVGSVPKRACG